MPAPALTQAVPYFEAWNAHDAGAVTAALADGGTYADPTTGGPLVGAALAEHARGLFGAFPDLNFEVVGPQPADAGADGTMVVQWLMRGTITHHAVPVSLAAIGSPSWPLIARDATSVSRTT